MTKSPCSSPRKCPGLTGLFVLAFCALITTANASPPTNTKGIVPSGPIVSNVVCMNNAIAVNLPNTACTPCHTGNAVVNSNLLNAPNIEPGVNNSYTITASPQSHNSIVSMNAGVVNNTNAGREYINTSPPSLSNTDSTIPAFNYNTASPTISHGANWNNGFGYNGNSAAMNGDHVRTHNNGLRVVLTTYTLGAASMTPVLNPAGYCTGTNVTA